MARVSTYPAATMRRAVELSDAGWKPTRIREYLIAEGRGAPSVWTIRTWIDPEYRERQATAGRRRSAERSAAEARFRLSSDTPEYRHAFMYELRSRGLSYRSIGTVHELVFGSALTEDQVEYVFREGDPKPRRMTKLRAA